MEQIQIGDKLLEISDARLRYSKLWGRYDKFATESLKNFDDFYYEIFSDIENVQMILSRWMEGQLKNTATFSVKELIKLKIYDVDDELFLGQYLDKDITWQEDISDVNDRYLNLVLSRDEYKKYEEGRSARSGSFVGGGFGLEGAASGILLATAANVAVETISGIASLVNSNKNDSSAIKDVRSLLEKKVIQKTIYLALYNISFNAHRCFLDIVNERVKTKYFDVIDKSQIRQSKAIVANINQDIIPDDSLEAACVQAFSSNPFNSELYKTMFDRNVIPIDDLCRVTNIFNQNIDGYIKLKQDLEQQKIKYMVEQEKLKPLKEGLSKILSEFHSPSCFIMRNIPENRLENAIKNYFTDSSDTALGLIDESVFGSAEIGAIFGIKGLYWATNSKKSYFHSWEAINSATDDFKVTESAMMINGDKLSLSSSGVDHIKLYALLKKLGQYVSS